MGFYFKPETGIEDIWLEIENAINLVPDKNKIILAGDLNLKPGTQKFEELCKLLQICDISN